MALLLLATVLVLHFTYPEVCATCLASSAPPTSSCRSGPPRSGSILQHDGPNHLGLWLNGLYPPPQLLEDLLGDEPPPETTEETAVERQERDLALIAEALQVRPIAGPGGGVGAGWGETDERARQNEGNIERERKRRGANVQDLEAKDDGGDVAG